MKNMPVIYTRDAILSWLEQVRPDIAWRDHIGDALPPLIHRAHWPRLAERYGLPFSRGHLANMDSRGQGPSSFSSTEKQE